LVRIEEGTGFVLFAGRFVLPVIKISVTPVSLLESVKSVTFIGRLVLLVIIISVALVIFSEVVEFVISLESVEFDGFIQSVVYGVTVPSDVSVTKSVGFDGFVESSGGKFVALLELSVAAFVVSGIKLASDVSLGLVLSPKSVDVDGFAESVTSGEEFVLASEKSDDVATEVVKPDESEGLPEFVVSGLEFVVISDMSVTVVVLLETLESVEYEELAESVVFVERLVLVSNV
jgi:hypothetical protein